MNSEIIKALPPMLFGSELSEKITYLPHYNESVIQEDSAARLMALEDLYHIYIPIPATSEIYSKLYLSALSSLRRKQTPESVILKNSTFPISENGIMGGSDSFTIIGKSGIGKSSAVNRSISLISDNRIITTTKPYCKIIPFLVVQCPFDSSVKGLLLEILRTVDRTVNTNYFDNAIKARASTDVLIGSVSQIAINHIGLLVVDEIQNVVNSKNGNVLIGSLTQLINNSGISVCMVGTPECVPFFETDMKLARRSLGIYIDDIPFDSYFADFCNTVLSYRYVKKPIKDRYPLIHWLYEHSFGTASSVISLIKLLRL